MLLRAEVDAYVAALHGLTRDELRYVLDPQDVYGLEFRSRRFACSRCVRSVSWANTAFAVWCSKPGTASVWRHRNRDGGYDAGPSELAARESPPALSVRIQPTSRLLAAQTVRERVCTPARSVPLLSAHERPDPDGAAHVPEGPKPRPDKVTRAAPSGDKLRPAQATPPGLAVGTASLRERVMQRTLQLLCSSAPLTGREIARQPGGYSRNIDRYPINSVLTTERATQAHHDPSMAIPHQVCRTLI